MKIILRFFVIIAFLFLNCKNAQGHSTTMTSERMPVQSVGFMHEFKKLEHEIDKIYYEIEKVKKSKRISINEKNTIIAKLNRKIYKKKQELHRLKSRQSVMVLHSR